MVTIEKGPDCIICGEPVEKWPGEGSGWGNNPDPWPVNRHLVRILREMITDQHLLDNITNRYGDPDDEWSFRCCRNCNDQVVIPLRIGLLAK